MDKFTKLLDNDIINNFKATKGNIVRYIKKNFKLNTDYIIIL